MGDRVPKDLAAALSQQLDAPALEQLRELLRRTCHDLNNPLGTMGLELFSLDEALTGLLAMTAADPAKDGEAREVAAILVNLDAARSRLETLVSELQQFARLLA